MNVNELILDRVRSLIFTDLSDGSVIGRLTNLEEPSLQTAAEGEEITNAQGALITKLFRAKTGTFSATNSLFSMDLLALQYGTDKEIADEDHKIRVPVEEILTVEDGRITLSHKPLNDVKYIYKLESGQLAQKFTLGAMASESEFTIADREITVPTDVTGKIYVEYEYETSGAVRVVNNTENFPEAVGVKIFAIFKDMCNENIKYAGTIVAKKGKIDPSSIETALTGTGKHSFSIDFMKDYCEDDGTDLFSVIVAN
ncbi:MAG: hypothetical protein NC079_00600 [Clostridium sp.]|nr:hypothetical protein [Acetatifactor muris]MCM1527464.1 hypothetical protein [Bacteroides sp.]MCM1562090.1 hypothetical protein [Clostridium sp.]